MVIHHVGIHRGDTAVNGDAAASPFTEPFSAILNHIIGHPELLIVTQTYRVQTKIFALSIFVPSFSFGCI